MPAQVLAAAAGLSGTDDAVAFSGKNKMRVFLQRRHASTVRDFES